MTFQNDIQAPINRQIITSSETIMYFIDVFEGLAKSFFTANDNDNVDSDNDLVNKTFGRASML